MCSMCSSAQHVSTIAKNELKWRVKWNMSIIRLWKLVQTWKRFEGAHPFCFQFVSVNIAKCAHCGNTAGEMANDKARSVIGEPATSTHLRPSSHISDNQLNESLCRRKRADPKLTTIHNFSGKVTNFVYSQNTPPSSFNRAWNDRSISGHLCTMTLFLLLLLSLSSCSLISKSTSASLPTSGLDIVFRCQQNCPQQLVSSSCKSNSIYAAIAFFLIPLYCLHI